MLARAGRHPGTRARFRSGNGADAATCRIHDQAEYHDLTLLTNYWEECDEGGADCSPGCFWSERLDAVVWIAPTTGQYVVLRGHLMIPEPSADDPWERLEREPVLPPGVAYADTTGVHVHGCGLARDVALPSAP